MLTAPITVRSCHAPEDRPADAEVLEEAFRLLGAARANDTPTILLVADG